MQDAGPRGVRPRRAPVPRNGLTHPVPLQMIWDQAGGPRRYWDGAKCRLTVTNDIGTAGEETDSFQMGARRKTTNTSVLAKTQSQQELTAWPSPCWCTPAPNTPSVAAQHKRKTAARKTAPDFPFCSCLKDTLFSAFYPTLSINEIAIFVNT